MSVCARMSWSGCLVGDAELAFWIGLRSRWPSRNAIPVLCKGASPNSGSLTTCMNKEVRQTKGRLSFVFDS